MQLFYKDHASESIELMTALTSTITTRIFLLNEVSKRWWTLANFAAARGYVHLVAASVPVYQLGLPTTTRNYKAPFSKGGSHSKSSIYMRRLFEEYY